MKILGSRLEKQRILILRAGSSAIGICDQIVAAMVQSGTAEHETKQLLWLVDSKGLVHSGRNDLESAKQKYAQPVERFAASSFSDV
ncbi:MAG TPA: malic enzyme-like NAD(P)-binding protein, partial [Pyrinomonadaceae bacterium]